MHLHSLLILSGHSWLHKCEYGGSRGQLLLNCEYIFQTACIQDGGRGQHQTPFLNSFTAILFQNHHFDLHSFGSHFYRSQVQSLHCYALSALLLKFVQIDGFSKLLNGLVRIDTLISLSCYMDFSKLVHGFL